MSAPVCFPMIWALAHLTTPVRSLILVSQRLLPPLPHYVIPSSYLIVAATDKVGNLGKVSTYLGTLPYLRWDGSIQNFELVSSHRVAGTRRRP